MRQFFEENGVSLLDPRELLWDNDSGLFKLEDDGHALYYDNQHLSNHGSEVLSSLFSKVLAAPSP